VVRWAGDFEVVWLSRVGALKVLDVNKTVTSIDGNKSVS
jgi:hypothetical protein